jgi:hypothetical protein
MLAGCVFHAARRVGCLGQAALQHLLRDLKLVWKAQQREERLLMRPQGRCQSGCVHAPRLHQQHTIMIYTLYADCRTNRNVAAVQNGQSSATSMHGCTGLNVSTLKDGL